MELSILLFSNTTFWVRLHKGERLVAELFMPKLLNFPFPFFPAMVARFHPGLR
ncbi:MAG: hypothetical protein FGF48_01770 [Candidatus Brockarchaeota archaeon]|nr:hypothetical protein [Candidatus Brockarchaeota archaeon]